MCPVATAAPGQLVAQAPLLLPAPFQLSLPAAAAAWLLLRALAGTAAAAAAKHRLMCSERGW
jgi:hypothetical protein